MTAIVTMRDATHEWDVVVSRVYKTKEEAQAGIDKMRSIYGAMVVGARIE